MQHLLRLWLIISFSLVVVFLVWGFAPILVPIALVGAGLALPVAIAIKGARWLERKRGARPPPDPFLR